MTVSIFVFMYVRSVKHRSISLIYSYETDCSDSSTQSVKCIFIYWLNSSRECHICHQSPERKSN